MPAPGTPPTAEELARQVVDVHDMQQRFYRSKNTDQLRECKALERKLRAAAEAVLHPARVQPLMFGEG